MWRTAPTRGCRRAPACDQQRGFLQEWRRNIHQVRHRACQTDRQEVDPNRSSSLVPRGEPTDAIRLARVMDVEGSKLEKCLEFGAR